MLSIPRLALFRKNAWEESKLRFVKRWSFRKDQDSGKMRVLMVETAEGFGGAGGGVFGIGCSVRARWEEDIEGFAPEDLLLEDAPEVGGDEVGELVEGGQGAGVVFQLVSDGSDGLVGDAAGDDELEVLEIGRKVEGEAVAGYGAGDVDADGGDFGGRRRIGSRRR